jgi:hypothetical protein
VNTTSNEPPLEPYRKSIERKRFNRFIALLALIVVLIVVTICIIAYYNIKPDTYYSNSSNDGLRFVTHLSIFLTVALGLVISAISYCLSRDRYTRRKQRAISASLRRTEGQLADRGTAVTFHELWMANNERIDFYHDIATTQSQASFRAAQVTALVGFLLIIALGLFAIFFGDGTAAIAASIIGLAAAGMSGYIGATFMKSQAEASAQLRLFFAQPVELARLLSAERLIQQHLPKDAQPSAVSSVLGAVVNQRVPQ